jgi:hypothetical protein
MQKSKNFKNILQCSFDATNVSSDSVHLIPRFFFFLPSITCKSLAESSEGQETGAIARKKI